MSSKNKSMPSAAPAPVQAPAPAPAPAPEVSQGENLQQGVQDEGAASSEAGATEGTGGADVSSSAPETAASATNEADAAALTGESGTVVTSASDKVGAQPTLAEVAAVQTARTEKVSPTLYSAEVQQYIDGLKSTAAKNGFTAFAQYLKDMAPGIAMDADKGADHQRTMYRTVQSLLEVQGEEFRVVFGVLLRIFMDNAKGALGGRYLYRFTENINMGKDDREGFMRIMCMLEHLNDPKTREHQLKLFDFGTNLKFGVSDGARRNILTFFKK